MELKQVNRTESDIQRLSQLAKSIWTEHYAEILGPVQIDYMLRILQSPEAIAEQMDKEGYQYYFLCEADTEVGYVGICPEETRLFLSKLYIDKRFRRRGFASATLRFLETLCRENGWKSIWLTVNRNNQDSIAVYEALGFLKTREQVSDIGDGFVMDDYIMEKTVL